jgi:hypothetical protein
MPYGPSAHAIWSDDSRSLSFPKKEELVCVMFSLIRAHLVTEI